MNERINQRYEQNVSQCSFKIVVIFMKENINSVERIFALTVRLGVQATLEKSYSSCRFHTTS